jgi:hypothetical protein
VRKKAAELQQNSGYFSMTGFKKFWTDKKQKFRQKVNGGSFRHSSMNELHLCMLRGPSQVTGCFWCGGELNRGL